VNVLPVRLGRQNENCAMAGLGVKDCYQKQKGTAVGWRGQGKLTGVFEGKEMVYQKRKASKKKKIRAPKTSARHAYIVIQPSSR